MKYEDPHDRRKAAIEDAMNAAAGDDEIARLRSELSKALATCALLEHTSTVVGEDQIQGLGKAAWEAHEKHWRDAGLHPNIRTDKWYKLSDLAQCAWVAAAKAVLQAAGRVEVLPADSSDTSR